MATAVMIAFNPTAAAADTALIMDGTGAPVPAQRNVDAIENLYLVPNGDGGYTPQALTTPEQGYPLTGVNSLTTDASIAQGVTILTDAIRQQTDAGNHVVVFGYSQSSVIASQVAANLASSPNPPSPDQVSFVLVGDEASPNGGLFTRFEVPGAPLSLPSLGETFTSATPNGPYPTSVYTLEYDGFADFPQYPLNVVSDVNAIVGMFTQHFGYADLTPAQISSAVPLQTTGDTTTKYYMIPTPNLPLLAPVRLLPLIGNPLADLVQPDLAVLVNLGYGSITNGWSPGPANVVTPIGLLPTNINPVDLVTALANGVPQGITNALNDLKTPQLFDLSSLSLLLSGLNTHGLTPSPTPSVLQLLAGFATLGNAGVPVSSSGGVVPTLSSVISNDLAVAKPIGDTALALTGTLPQYDAQLFVSQLQAGNPINAVGLPIAADVGLPFALTIDGVFPVVGAVATTVTQLAQLTGLQPNPPAAPAPAAITVNTTVQSAVSTKAGANTASAPNSVQSVVNTAVSLVPTPVRSAVSSVITPVRTALTGGSKPVTAAVSKPTTPAAVTSVPTVKPAAGHWKKH
jgi:PE-PPE domain